MLKSSQNAGFEKDLQVIDEYLAENYKFLDKNV